MGVSGLLPLLEQATKPCHIAEFRGATVVIDTYCWLHRGANACAVQLAHGEDTKVYVDYCLRYVKMLQSYNIRPILVFDGKNLPAKADTEAKRRESRNKAKQRAAELLRLGKTEEARTYLKQSINVTPEMASAVIKECRKLNVDCMVAPYECDAQLAYFNLKGIAEVVITEDSDLVLFGCSKVMFKLDLRGMGYLVEADKIPQAMKLSPEKYTFDKFRYMCILSGCDYIPSLRGIGLKKAMKFIKMTEETNPQIFLDKVPRYLNMRHLQITDEYKRNFMLANATFRHQTVFDPFKRKLVPLTDPAVCGTNPEYCKNAGEIFDHEVAYQVALGNLHPTTLKPLDNWAPSESGSSTSSIWSGCYKKSVSRKVQKAQFREFFKSKVKVDVIDDDDEQIKIEEENKLVNELEFYSRKCSDTQKPSTSQTVDIPISPEKVRLSPILKRNPFIIDKKLSKFHRTSTSTNVIVKSRYFTSGSEKMEEDSKVKGSINVESNELSDVENIPNNGIAAKLEENVHLAEEESESSVELAENKSKAEDLSTETNEFIQNETIIEKSEDKVHLVVDVSDSSNEAAEGITEKLGLDFTQKVTVESNSWKRKSTGPCRSIGLKRLKQQKTIQDFFGKINNK